MAARSSPAGSEPGFRGPTVIKLVGITYRQLDYWARTGLVTPSVRAADGSGTQRLYGFTDVVELRIIKRLLDAGVSLRQIRDAIALAVRANTPIFAEEDVLSEASILIKSDDEEREVEKFREFLDQVSPEDFE